MTTTRTITFRTWNGENWADRPDIASAHSDASHGESMLTVYFYDGTKERMPKADFCTVVGPLKP